MKRRVITRVLVTDNLEGLDNATLSQIVNGLVYRGCPRQAQAVRAVLLSRLEPIPTAEESKRRRDAGSRGNAGSGAFEVGGCCDW